MAGGTQPEISGSEEPFLKLTEEQLMAFQKERIKKKKKKKPCWRREMTLLRMNLE